METSVDRATGQVTYSQSNPLFDMSLSRSDIYRFQNDDVKSPKPRGQWCLNVIIVYLILLTGVNVFLLYKVFTLESSPSVSKSEKLASSNHIPLGGAYDDDDLPTLIRNNSQETKSLRGHLGILQSQVISLCGEEGQLSRLKADLGLVNASTHLLEGKLATISLKPGPPGPPGIPGMKGNTGLHGLPGSPGSSGKPGDKGDKGDIGEVGPAGPSGPKGENGETGTQGPPGVQGPPGPSGPPGVAGPRGQPGPAGAEGRSGPPGVPGNQGPGAKGEKGDPGIVGPPGVAGRDGLKGDKGDTGTSGVPGPRGAPGQDGARGSDGHDGMGIPGPRGPPGFNGTTGPRGPPGPKGDAGPQGLPGQKGEEGSQVEPIVRLVGGTNRGRVEVKYGGVWGTVCDDSFDTLDGTVICKMLGYQRATSAFTASPGSGKIWLDELRCRGTESSIFDCVHGGAGVHNCEHNEDAGVQCV